MDRNEFTLFSLDVPYWNLNEREIEMLRAVEFMLDEQTSLRRTSKNTTVSKSCLHLFIHKELGSLSIEAYDLAKELLKRNYRERNNFKLFPRGR